VKRAIRLINNGGNMNGDGVMANNDRGIRATGDVNDDKQASEI